MKKLVVLLTLVATVSVYSQGTVNFNNRVGSNPPIVDAPISYDSGGPAPVGPINGTVSLSAGGFTWGGINAMAGLYGGAAGTPEANLILLAPAVGFRSGAASGYVLVGSLGERAVPNVDYGAPAIFQIRAWDAGASGILSYEEAAALVSDTRGVYLGKSGLVNVTALGGGGSPPASPANLLGLQGFSMAYTIVPEPSIIGLGILGGLAGLMVFRRRN